MDTPTGKIGVSMVCGLFLLGAGMGSCARSHSLSPSLPPLPPPHSVTNNRNAPRVPSRLLAVIYLGSLGDGVSAMVITLPGQYGVLLSGFSIRAVFLPIFHFHADF